MESKRTANGEQIGEQKESDWTPPRGVRWFEDSSRPSPFFVQWREVNKKKTKAFATANQRLAWTKNFVSDRDKKTENDIADFDPKEWIRWLEFKRIVAGADPMTIAVEWKQRQADASMPFSEAAKRYQTVLEGEVEKATFNHAKGDLKRLVEAFGSSALSMIQPDDIRAFLKELPFAPVTKRNHYKRLNALYNWAKRERLLTFNPCDAVEPPPLLAEEVSVIPVESAFKLFQTAAKHAPKVCARLALEAFAGIRFSTAAQLVKEDINFVDRGVNLPAAKTKKTEKVRKRHYIEHLPENLWPWLTSAPAAAWTMTPRQYLAEKSRVFTLAEITNPGNVLRHSFCSYHVSLHADAAKTAVILTHSNQAMLWKHYRGRATSTDGAKYFEITPESVKLTRPKFSAHVETSAAPRKSPSAR